MERSTFLPLPEGMVIGQIEIAEAQLTVEVISTQPFPAVEAPQTMFTVSISAPSTMCRAGAVASSCGSVCASSFAACPAASGRCLLNGFLISSSPGHG
jgi:hypothetical protein